MSDGYAIAIGSVYQGGSWNHDDDWDTPDVPAVFKSTDNGSNWNRYALDSSGGFIYSITIHPTDTNIIFAGGEHYDAGNNWVAGLYKSTDGGSDWEEIGASIAADCINDVKLDPFNANKIFVGTVQGVYISTNNGSTWQTPSVYMNATCIAVDPTTTNKLFVGCTDGVYISTDGGSSWTMMNDGLFDKDVNCIDFDAINGVLYVGTDGGGVFRSSVGTPVQDDDVQIRLPTAAILYQNFPNPFNMSTEIRYELPNSSRVNLSIFDINGRLIRKLVGAHQEAGLMSVTWDGKDTYGREVSSGLYIYKLQTADHVEMKKMVLQK